MAVGDPKITIRAKDNTRGAFKSVRGSLGRMKSALFSAKTAIAGLAGAAGFGLLIKKSFGTIDALAKQSDQLGITTEAYAGLQHALSITTDGSVNLKKALLTMQRTIREADNGLATYTRAYDELGLSVEALQDLNAEEQFLAISDALKQVENDTRRAALATDVFGARNAQLLNTARLGSEGIKQLSAEAVALGLAVERVDASKIEAANDAFTRIRGVVSGIANRIAVALAPWLQAISEMMVNASIKSEGFKDVITSGIRTSVTAVGFLADIFRGLKFVWIGLQVAFLTMVNFVVMRIVDIDRIMTDVLNKIPGVTAEVSTVITALAAGLNSKLEEMRTELDELVLKPLPSASIDAFFDNIETRAIRAANVVKVQQGRIVDAADTSGDQLTKNAGKDAKEQFTLAKELNLALAIANAPTAISGAYKVGAQQGGPYLGGLYAAAAALFELRQIQAVRGTSLGGGGGGSAGGTGGAGVGSPGTPQPPPTDQAGVGLTPGPIDVRITVDGTGQLDREQTEAIADSLRDLILNGAQPI